ncbi:MAG: type II toxin-antitoxin system ParD family antitoxin [Sphingomonadaceae bacterium]|nr:type II toxin-antitoxin system ParD family antitoxin [Sphingomonadaceae bacterium]
MAGGTSIALGDAEAIGLRLVAEGRFPTLAEACRAGLRRLADDARFVDRLVALGEEGLASGIDDGFDIDAFVAETGTAA